VRMGLSSKVTKSSKPPNGRSGSKLLARAGADHSHLGLPDIQGHDLLRMIRAAIDSVPIVVLSSRGDERARSRRLISVPTII